MTRRAGEMRYARIVLAIQIFLVGVVVAELFDRAHSGHSPAPVNRPHAPDPPPFPNGRLQARVGDLEFNGTQLDEVLRTIAQRSGENLGVNWPELQANIGVTPTGAVSLRMRSPTFASALDEICRRLPSKSPFYAAYGEGAGGIVVLGTVTSQSDWAVPTLASVFDVHDLLGPPAKLQPLPRAPPYELPRDVQAREDVRELEKAIETLVPATSIISFGSRLIVSGGPQASRVAKLTLDAIRHPIQLRLEENEQTDSGPVRFIMQKELADTLLKYWRTQFGSDVTFHASAATSDSPEEPVIVSVSGASFQDLRGSIDGLFEFPIVYIAEGEEGGFAHIRRVRLEEGPRAYDVSPILAESERWMNPAGAVGDKRTVTLKEKQDALKELVHHCDSNAWSFDPTESSPIAFWNGLLIVRQDPAVHRHLLKFLEHLQRTGRPVDPPPEQ